MTGDEHEGLISLSLSRHCDSRSILLNVLTDVAMMRVIKDRNDTLDIGTWPGAIVNRHSVDNVIEIAELLLSAHTFRFTVRVTARQSVTNHKSNSSSLTHQALNKFAGTLAQRIVLDEEEGNYSQHKMN